MSIVDQTSGVTYATLSDAINGSAAGDVIAVSAGTYTENFPKITHSLTIEGVGGLAHLEPLGTPSNGEGILVIDAPSVTLDDLELSGATVPAGNGAGIRFESGGTLTVSNCWIHDNQDGILTGDIAGATLSIDHTEVDDNGTETGSTHNIYIGQIGTFDITDSYVHDALGGHEIKSRAAANVISDNRITDGATADTSYSIDLPDGGVDTISRNVIEKGAHSPNNALIHFGGELYPSYAGSSLAVTNNSITDDRQNGTPVLVTNQTQDSSGNIAPVQITDDTLYGITASQLSNDPVTASGNTVEPLPGPALDTSHPFTTTACFCPGTRIATPAGERAIATLRIGDLVTTHAGEHVPILWIGRRRHAAAEVAGQPQLRPVLIAAHALGFGQPARRLAVSPQHAFLVDGALIPAAALVNGVSITRGPAAAVRYLHLELERHELILAEGCPTESFVDHAGRSMFDNHDEYARMFPDAPKDVPALALARLSDGPRVTAAWRRIAGRRGPGLRPAPCGSLRGHVERVAGGVLEGWAADGATSVELEILLDDGSAVAVVADGYRVDLDHAGLSDGRCAFRMRLPVGAVPITVRRRSDGARLPIAA